MMHVFAAGPLGSLLCAFTQRLPMHASTCARDGHKHLCFWPATNSVCTPWKTRWGVAGSLLRRSQSDLASDHHEVKHASSLTGGAPASNNGRSEALCLAGGLLDGW